MTQSTFLVSFPLEEEQALHWWCVEDGAILTQGCDQDPLTDADIFPSDDADSPIQIVALVPSAQSVVRWYDMPEGTTEKQALAAAISEAKSQSLNPDDTTFAAAQDGGLIATMALATEQLATGLTYLQSLGMDPDTVTSAGFLLNVSEEQTVVADFGFDRLLRGIKLIAADEPLVRNHLLSAATIEEIPQPGLDAAIVSMRLSNQPNLRTGQFAKKNKRQMSREQKKTLTWLAVALLLTTIAIPILQLYQYHKAASVADEAAVDAATKIVGTVENLEIAEQQLDQKLLVENLGNNRFTVPTAGLFSALQQVPGVSVSRLAYSDNGLLSVELTSVRNEDINPALLAIQDQGYVISATPRQDASGLAKADVTVRMP